MALALARASAIGWAIYCRVWYRAILVLGARRWTCPAELFCPVFVGHCHYKCAFLRFGLDLEFNLVYYSRVSSLPGSHGFVGPFRVQGVIFAIYLSFSFRSSARRSYFSVLWSLPPKIPCISFYRTAFPALQKPTYLFL